MEKLGIVEARVEAANQSKKSGKPRYIVVDADGDCTVETKPPATLSNLAAVYRNGSEDKTAIEFTSEPVTTTEGKTKEPKVKKEKVMKTTHVPKTKKTNSPAWKERADGLIPRGNNMTLTKSEWTKIDAILKKEELSFGAWSKSLVKAKIK